MFVSRIPKLVHSQWSLFSEHRQRGAPREDAKDVSRGEKGIISKAYSVSPNGRCKAWASRLGRCLWKLKGRSECRAASLREFCEMNVHCVEYCGWQTQGGSLRLSDRSNSTKISQGCVCSEAMSHEIRVIWNMVYAQTLGLGWGTKVSSL